MASFILLALLAVSYPQIAAQQDRVFSTSSSSSSFSTVSLTPSSSVSSSSSQVSASGSSASELQTQLQSAAETALSTLSSNPDADLNSVLQQLAQVVLSEIGQLFVTLFQGGAASIDASAVAKDISSAVGAAISVAVSSVPTSSFADIDIDTIQSTIQSSVKGSLTGLGANADISRVTTEIARGVLNAIGDALAKVTGQSFTFELSVQASQSGGSTAVTSSSVSTRSQFEASFSSQAQKALVALEANPDGLSNVMAQISTLIITSVQELLVNMSSASDIKAAEFSLAISLAIKDLLSTLAASSSTYANIDIAGITSTIEARLKTIFTQSSIRSTINVQTLASQVANTVITNVGPALARASGASFSFTIGVGGTSSEASSVASSTKSQTSVTIQGISEFQTEFQAALEAAFAQLDGSTDNIRTVFLTLSNKILTLLGRIIITIISEGNTDMKAVSAIITDAIQKALSAATSSSTKFEKLDVSKITISIQTPLDKILGNIGNVKNVNANELTGDIAIAVLTPMAESFSDVTGNYNWSFQINTESTPPSASITTVTTGTTEASAPASSISTGTSSRNVQLQVSSEILSSLKNTGATIKLIQEAADKQQTIAISAAFLQAIEEGSDADLSKVLTLFFTDEQITSATMGLILTLTISGGNQRALNLLTNTIKETSDLTKLSAVFKFAFTTKDSDVTDAFSALVSSSVNNNKCDLLKVIEAALNGATPVEVEQISSALEKADAKVCIPAKYSSTTTTTTATAATNSPTKPVPASTNIKSPEVVNSAEEASPIVPAPNVPTPAPISAPITPTPKPQTSGECVDVTPPGGYTCEQQKKFGKCGQAQLKEGGFCAKTCDLCPKQEACTDILPDKRYTCADQKKFGKCEAAWIETGGYCAATCGRCVEATPEATPTATLAPKTPAPKTPAMKGNVCECSCCDCELGADKITQMVKDITQQVLAEIQP